MALQPTNAGINYQQRTAAQFLSLMLTDFDLDTWLPGSNGTVETIRFESRDAIDDLVLENNTGDLYYIQVKHSLSLSSRQDSQFYKVMDQFVRQYLIDPDGGKYYLALSSSSSGMLHNRLSKILNNIRRSHDIENLYLNKSDKNILDTFFLTVNMAYQEHTGKKLNSTTLLHLCERIYVVVYEVEDGLSGETACKMLLASINAIEYEQIWHALIVDALDFAANRSAVTKKYLRDKYNSFFHPEEIDKFFMPVLKGDTQIGYDIVLGHSPKFVEFLNQQNTEDEQRYSEDSYLLLQLYRFDASGKKQISKFYPDNLLVMPGETEVEVIHRCSSIVGMERYLETQQLAGKTIIDLLGHGDGQEDHYPEAQLHKRWVTEQLSKATNLYCIHCEEPISGENSYLVEIDNAVETLKVGRAHVKCTRPVDRVLGLLKGPVFDEYSYLKAFDYAFWSRAKGQRLFTQLKSMGIFNSHMLWNDDIQSVKKGRFCIKAQLENGEYTYVTQRGYVVRGARAYIDSQVELHNRLLNQLSEDPFGFTSISNAFGNYSSLAGRLEVGEEFRRCLYYEAAPFTSTVHELFDVEGDYYAPLAYLTVEGSIAVIDGYVFMLTNPLDLQKYLKNWKEKIGYDFGDNYCVATLKNDAEFDDFMRDATINSIKIIVDPWFGNRKDLVKGCLIDSYDMEILQEMQNLPNNN